MTVTVPRQRKKTKVLRIPKTGFGIECLIFFIILFEYHFFYLFDYEVGIIALILKIHEFLIGCLIIVAGILLGNYVQQNKEMVKDKIRKIVDKW